MAGQCESIVYNEEEKLNAETAVSRTADLFAEMFASMDDSYMKEVFSKYEITKEWDVS